MKIKRKLLIITFIVYRNAFLKLPIKAVRIALKDIKFRELTQSVASNVNQVIITNSNVTGTRTYYTVSKQSFCSLLRNCWDFWFKSSNQKNLLIRTKGKRFALPNKIFGPLKTLPVFVLEYVTK